MHESSALRDAGRTTIEGPCSPGRACACLLSKYREGEKRSHRARRRREAFDESIRSSSLAITGRDAHTTRNAGCAQTRDNPICVFVCVFGMVVGSPCEVTDQQRTGNRRLALFSVSQFPFPFCLFSFPCLAIIRARTVFSVVGLYLYSHQPNPCLRPDLSLSLYTHTE